ncbi:chloramphenicol acetyltransferase [Flavobacterium akiainvivens]|uniref:Chloramphenicol acetyltransferase n=1 Tax=Flavobacterium akiainvivens TaxID=1202724 RepID=A0A0M9VIY9_9FLAO|nr:chloramphenicol acetyltransferase [Flavobacterium akiainvivens]KOS07176.1 chloramphenicol acetyltransferase [Flavobacterium akiainvivens]SFQ72953.1 chloramphenicol O-acetyltransferase type A [Flavobacterium akiainvivens]
MPVKLDLTTWPRKEHFEFFSRFEEPFFGLVATIDCTKGYAAAKEAGVPFSLYYLHKTLAAVNGIEAFCYRIKDGEVWLHEQVDVSSTVMRDDTTFGFSFMEYYPDLHTFVAGAQAEIARVQNTPGLITRTFDMDNIIHFSAIPWIDFTSLSHARSFTFPDSCPKVSIGKMTVNEAGKRTMPVSLHVHHGLMDGYHTGLFYEALQREMDGE